MNLQILIVGTIVLLAFLYVAKSVWGKVKSFSAKTSCGGDCGCEAKSSGKTLPYIAER